MLVTLLDEEDQSLLDEIYDGLGQGERDRLLQEAVRILRARGWRRPELAGKDLERMMKELLLTQRFGPDRLRKYREPEAEGGKLTEAISTQGPNRMKGGSEEGHSRA